LNNLALKKPIAHAIGFFIFKEKNILYPELIYYFSHKKHVLIAFVVF